MGDLILDAMMIGYAGKAVSSCNVINGGFETGDLTGWTPTGDVVIVLGGAEGTYACDCRGNFIAVPEAKITQTINRKCNGQTLHFQYKSFFQFNPGYTYLTLCADGAPCQDYALIPAQPFWTVYEVVWPDAIVNGSSSIQFRAGTTISPSLQALTVDDIRFL
jgi:hypothetical protein